MSDPEDAGVGYRRPPKSTQFKPGRSGNPRGRPKHTRNLRTDLADELAELVPVREGGREFKISKQRAVLKAVVAAAVKGDMRAATAIINLCAKVFGTGEPTAPDETLSSDDQALFQEFIAAEIARRSKEQKNE